MTDTDDTLEQSQVVPQLCQEAIFQGCMVEIEQEVGKVEQTMKQLVARAMIAVFDRHPRLTAVSWQQYTPYFNDGDPTSFGLHDIQLTFDGVEYHSHDGPRRADIEACRAFDRAVKAAKTARNLFSEAFLLLVFNDHSEVKITRNQFTVTTCEDHD